MSKRRILPSPLIAPIGVALSLALGSAVSWGQEAQPSLDALLEKAEASSAALLNQFALAILMIGICTAIHILLTGVVVLGCLHPAQLRRAAHSPLRRILLISITAFLTFIAMTMEIVSWALLYLQQGALSGVEEALYFSGVTFASLGYGDITLDPRFRLLSSLEAMVGILMAGWSTALLVAVSQRMISLLRESQASSTRQQP
jgi:hypothetical protein